MILPRRIRAAIALGWRFAVVVVAAGAAAVTVFAPPESFGPPEPAAKPTALHQADPPAAEASSPRNVSYPAIALYPLFYPTRTPWSAPPPPPPAPEVKEPSTLTGYNLVGVVVSGAMRTAMIRAQENKVVTLAEGQEIDGWTLKSITPERLYFTAGETTYEMIRRKPSETQR